MTARCEGSCRSSPIKNGLLPADRNRLGSWSARRFLFVAAGQRRDGGVRVGAGTIADPGLSAAVGAVTETNSALPQC